MGIDVEVPVPPFADPEQARLFQRLLLLYLRDLKGAGEAVGKQQFVLAGVVGLHAPELHAPEPRRGTPGRPRCGSCATPYPCRTTLAVAVGAGLPIGWRDPVQVARVLADAGHEPRRGGEVTPGRVLWADGWGAVRQDDGSWEVGIPLDRGEYATERVEDDAAMAARLAATAGTPAPFPYGWVEDEDEAASMGPAAARAIAAWDGHVALPYLEEHRRRGAPRA
ncbi:hypothetical protein ABH931_007251 [Streptacidiphilus sp. MAP12-33]|uniref:hypothetical protein n=1 Tax=Streptacidiphilus sp. MAP12-33 TaxID=3156266 RepID=UPI003513C224